jgi:TIR domain/Bacterial Ig-like domain (group 2)
MADIFLSYAKQDRDVARKLSRLLVKAGWTVWWDRRIPAGRTWRRMLEAALRDMRCMVVLWSSHSIESDWVKEEAEEGRVRRKLLPVLIETVNPPVGFRSIQAADLTDWDGVGESLGARQLIADIELLIGKPARPGTFESKPRTPPGQSANQTRSEVIVTGVERAERRAEHEVGAQRSASGKNAVPWKSIAGAGVALVLAIGVIALWRDSAPVTDEAVTAVATVPMRSTPEPFPAPKVVKLGIHAARQELKPEETLPLSLRGRFSDGSEGEITNAIEWSSSNARVAKVDAEGRVTALQAGTAEITASYDGVSSFAWTLAVKSLPSKPAPADAIKAPSWNVADEPRPRKRSVYMSRKRSAEEVVTRTPKALPLVPELTPEQLQAKVAPYISRAKNFRAQGDYRAAMVELATARAIDPTSQEVGAEIKQTKRACIAEKKLVSRGLDC